MEDRDWQWQRSPVDNLPDQSTGESSSVNALTKLYTDYEEDLFTLHPFNRTMILSLDKDTKM